MHKDKIFVIYLSLGLIQALQQPELGERFFFTSVTPAAASPEELFLSPVWEQAFSSANTSLLVLD